MKTYHKINSIFKRDPKTGKFLDEYSTPQFELLKDIKWEFTEKIDGTNIRVEWDHEARKVKFGGRTKDAQIPCVLLDVLLDKFTVDLFTTKYPDVSFILYGEGFGKKIQKTGSYYLPDSVDFILFDIYMWNRWVPREEVIKIADNLQLKKVPIVGWGTLAHAIGLVKGGLKSTFGDFTAEGIVARPAGELLSYFGERIIAKIKNSDFK